MIDLRSDTVTRPTPDMLSAMIKADVGDDVFSEDPTVNKFQQKIAGMFGKQAGLFVPSGTMGNQLCLHVLTKPGDEIIIDELGHIFNYETGAAAHLSSLQLKPLQGDQGKLNSGLVRSAIRTRNEWDPWSRVVAIENTTNKGGGACYLKNELLSLREVVNEHNLKLHLDGARIWNAITATGIEPEFFGEIADTISVCFSKGLGAPVGSMILGTDEMIRKARRSRKMWGGGMRQIGILAAAADFAVEHHWSLLEEDHRRARMFAEMISEVSAYSVEPDRVETNIVLFKIHNRSAAECVDKLAKHGIGMVAFGPNIVRATFHFQVGDKGVAKAVDQLKNMV